MANAEKYINLFQKKYEQFLAGCDSVEELERWNTSYYGDMDVFYTNDLVSVIISLIASDGEISQKEAVYLNEAFGFDMTLEALTAIYENCPEAIDNTCNETFASGIDRLETINPKLAEAYRELLSLICDIIMESDGVITEKEVAKAKALKAQFE
jgi:hypothetical protein